MAIEYGKNWQVYLNTNTYASPTWTLVANQKELDFAIDHKTVDTTVKSNLGWTTTAPTTSDFSCSFSILYDLSETTHAAIMTAAIAKTLKHWRLTSTTNENYIFQAYIKPSFSAGVDGVVEVSIELLRSDVPVRALTV